MAPLLALTAPPSASGGAQFKLLNRRLLSTRTIATSLLITSFALFILTLRSFNLAPTQHGSGGSSWLSSFSSSQKSDSDPENRPNFFDFETTSAFYPVSQDDVQSKSIQDLCAGFPHYLTENRIQAVLKMGHGEDPRKRQAQFDSVSACFRPDELLIFSDKDETVILGNETTTPHRAIDVLANLPQKYHEGDNSQFANYDRMRELLRDGRLTKDNDPTVGKNGWALDKYKFLGEVERSWSMRPNRDWYVFYESDTYVVWDNMFRLLQGLDPATPLYMGSPSPGRTDEEAPPRGRGLGGTKEPVKTWFANGGPGFVLSRGAMEKLLGRRSEPSTGRYLDPPLTLKWLDLIQSDCCGDSVLGWALWKAGIPLSGLFPMFNVYPIHGIPYTERQWCQPVLTMHKPDPKDMMELWQWEQGRRKLGRPLLYADLYEFRGPGSSNSQRTRENWDNTNYDRLARGHDVSADDLASCAKACDDDPTCFQYMWRGELRRSCVLMPFINLGEAKQPETKEKNVTVQSPADGSASWKMEVERFTYTSGWLPARIRKWRDEHPCGDQPDWLWASIERYF